MNDKINITDFIFKLKVLQEKFSPYAKIINDFFIEHKEDISLILTNFFQNLATLDGFLENELWEKLKEYGWVLPKSLPMDIFGDLYYEIQDNLNINYEQQVFDNFFVQRFTANKWYYIDYLIKSWKNNKNFKQERYNIIKDCFKIVRRYSHKTAANVVIPTLIAQIEGLITDIYADKKQIPESDNALNAAKYLICTHLFTYTKSKGLSNIEKIDISRNKILHGEYTSYGKIETVIKLFLLIEIIVNTNIEYDNTLQNR